ncbi:hypothetical protein GWI33_007340 [Rhynchophorus ferrugineus]|uniref:Tetraspanin n=1 Tax=Rhynchophorus ferrugineus TaxID=354439 RepID=A0A834IK31_RHYFE|nr:hypothetical protein GWI33_007340 [Rhynchophorus ferrugineus]
MPPQPSSFAFKIIKWMLIVVFLLGTLLIVTNGIVCIIYGIKVIREVSHFDRMNGCVLATIGIMSCIYGVVMCYLVQRKPPNTWIQTLLVGCIVTVTLQMIFGSAGVRVGILRKNKNVDNYLKLLYRHYYQDKYARKVIDKVHDSYECCGLYGNRSFAPRNAGTYIDTCCKEAHLNCTAELAFEEGCEVPITKFHRANFYGIGSMWIAFATIHMVITLLVFYFQSVYINRPDHYA